MRQGRVNVGHVEPVIQKVLYERKLPFKMLCEGKDRAIYNPKKEVECYIRNSTTSNSYGLQFQTQEIYDESDPFFHYISSIDKHDFTEIKSISNLLLDFNEFPNYLMKIFNKQAEKNKNSGIVTMGMDGGLTQEVCEVLPLKKSVAFYRNFKPQDLPTLRHKINNEFTKQSEKITDSEDNLLHLVDTVRIKTPNIHEALLKLKVL